MKRVAKAEKDPATGKVTAISPRAWTVQKRMAPITMNEINSDAGPPVARAEPEPIKSPVPEVIRQIYFSREIGGTVPTY
jgi:hypothetical protein